MREGTLKNPMASRRTFALLLVVAGAAACSTRTPGGGVLVTMSVEGDLRDHPLTELRIAVTSIDGGATYGHGGYALGDAGAASVRFPTSVGIDSNGDPNATATLDLSVLDGTQAVDVQRYRLESIPTTSVVALPIAFGSSCGTAEPVDGGATCPLECLCPWNADLELRVCDLRKLSAPGADSGCPPAAARDAGLDAKRQDASDADEEDAGNVEMDARAIRDGMGSADAGQDADTGADAGEDAPLNIPCDAPCSSGQQCVEGICIPAPPSCAGGGPGAGLNCGSSGIDDCCASDEVASGTFLRDYGGVMFEDDSHPASVSQFRLDRYEVTVGRFRAFVEAVSTGDASPPWTPSPGSGKHTHLNGGDGLSNGGDGGAVYEPGWDKTWNDDLPQTKADWDAQLLRSDCIGDAGTGANDWTSAIGADGNEKRPINCASWYEAYAFCVWDGAFLPSVTEWDYAASGGAEQNEFAWGNSDPGRNAKLAVYNCYYPPSPTGQAFCQGLASIAPVGSEPMGVGVWGQLDLNGNVFEYLLDYAPAADALPCVDCAETASGTTRALRGGSFESSSDQLYNSAELYSSPEFIHGDVGMRCARVPGR